MEGGHDLDPSAQEFFPTLTPIPAIPLIPPQFFYPYPFPAYVGAFIDTSPPPPLPPPPPPPQPPTFMQAPLPPPLMTPSRALLLSMIPCDVSESIVRRELEPFGDVRAVEMDRVRDGLVTVHFYDLRNSQTALVEIQGKHMQQQCRIKAHHDAVLVHNSYGLLSPPPPPPPPPPPARGMFCGRAMWAQFTFPMVCNIPDGYNQGTLVIFNLDPNVSASNIQEMFQIFGPVRELRDTPMKKHHRFIEFYDTRDAEKAMREMNGKVVHGKRIVIEFSRPGGLGKKFNNSGNGYTKFSRPGPGNFSPPRRPPLETPPPIYRRKTSTPLPEKRNLSKNPSPSVRIEDSMESLSINVDSSREESSTKKISIKKNGNNNNSSGDGSGGKERDEPRHKRIWRGSRESTKEYESRFFINEDAIKEDSNTRDSRTTVMIKNIPNKYSQKLLLNMLDSHCITCNDQIANGDDQPLSSYDFVYLPIDFINKCNVGYGFVNMTSPEATWRLYKAFHNRSWQVFNSRKICEITYARLQGVDALQEHFKNSKFPCDAEEYLPVMFSPPRDGVEHLTDPTPIVGCHSIPDLPHIHSPSSDTSSSFEMHGGDGDVGNGGGDGDVANGGDDGDVGNDGCDRVEEKDGDDGDVGIDGGGSHLNGGDN